MPRKKLDFEGYDGSLLSALLEYPSHTPRAYVLFAHCFSCGKDIAAASRISRALVALGFSVLRFDFTGLGNSQGDFENTNFSSNVQDLINAASFLEDEHMGPELLIGHSLGGTAVLAAAAGIKTCRAIVTIGSPFDPQNVTKNFGVDLQTIEELGEAEVSLGGRKFKIKKQFLDDVRNADSSNAIAHLRKPLLVMHSPLDRTVSINEAEKIYVAAKHPKSFVSLDNADHLLSNKADAEYAAAIIAQWAGKYIEGKGEAPGVNDIESGQLEVAEYNQKFARVVRSDNHEWMADEPTTVGGEDLGPDPYEHLLAALGTCTSMTIRMYANRKNLQLEDVKVKLSHSRDHVTDCEGCEDQPKKIEILDREISFIGDLTQEEREKLMEIADKCPVHKTLLGEISITSRMVGLE
jgi:uncharacterized OsmC-like protein/fermentation-respiration switch protein FrsA (DUF1100 family)